jgi:hypothetical protein
MALKEGDPTVELHPPCFRSSAAHGCPRRGWQVENIQLQGNGADLGH